MRQGGRRDVRALAAGLVAAMAVLGGCASAAARHSDSIGLTIYGSPVGAVAVHGRTLSGQPLRLESLHGHVVVVNVWASWCRPCTQESRLMAAAARRLAPSGVRFVGVDEHDSASRARSFVAGVGARYPQLSDPAGTLLSQLPQLPQAGIPSTLVLDRAGRPAARIIGPASRGMLVHAVHAALRK